MKCGPGPIDPKSCNYGWLRKASRRISLVYDRTLAPSGLTTAQFAILAEIGAWKEAIGPTMAALADALIMDRAALTQSVKPLIGEGLVEVNPDAHDRRARRASLTDFGQRRLAEATDLWNEAQTNFSNAFGEDEAAALRALLRMVVSRVSSGDPSEL